MLHAEVTTDASAKDTSTIAAAKHVWFSAPLVMSGIAGNIEGELVAQWRLTAGIPPPPE
jgi:hypothetical protein